MVVSKHASVVAAALVVLVALCAASAMPRANAMSAHSLRRTLRTAAAAGTKAHTTAHVHVGGHKPASKAKSQPAKKASGAGGGGSKKSAAKKASGASASKPKHASGSASKSGSDADYEPPKAEALVGPKTAAEDKADPYGPKPTPKHLPGFDEDGDPSVVNSAVSNMDGAMYGKHTFRKAKQILQMLKEMNNAGGDPAEKEIVQAKQLLDVYQHLRDELTKTIHKYSDVTIELPSDEAAGRSIDAAGFTWENVKLTDDPDLLRAKFNKDVLKKTQKAVKDWNRGAGTNGADDGIDKIALAGAAVDSPRPTEGASGPVIVKIGTLKTLGGASEENPIRVGIDKGTPGSHDSDGKPVKPITLESAGSAACVAATLTTPASC
eukprot:NODE_1277_length_1400_cov_42.215240_g1266_i0.p2 GENE.NODE_1277_length_1400_cov_42.215240_g1266_i0~~NODE_1277_length_1400_cov_42.215240_g1266_i0.p2  ORF type:complete len:400 (-),score=132.71 NODE_1277_length_1400_cov_42.215240_g1266_i0:201-1337(-)